MKITNHHELRRDVSIDCSSPIITDQSFKNSCDINVIMAQYTKTGMLPSVNNQEPRYIDNTIVSNLEQAFNAVIAAENLFYDLPADVRKLMDNDPSQLEYFVQDPKNEAILIQNGIILKKNEIKPEPIKQEVQNG